ncbi:MAG: hypothetical protein KDA21_01215 [Phycisphaerales bacterium]|nr:hypothetical protein [Phycisphaerales bacterium]
MTPEERSRQRLIEQVCSPMRRRSRAGVVLSHPAWHDLSDADRIAAYDATVIQRQIEAALDRSGLSSTARAVLRRIER